MITFNISTITPEDDKIVVFYDFSNGETNSNKFDKYITFTKIMKWGNDRIKFFEERELELEKIAQQLEEEIIINTQEDVSNNI